MDAKKDLYWLIGLLTLLLILWYTSGGPDKMPAASKLFFKNPSDKYAEQITNQILNSKTNKNNSSVTQLEQEKKEIPQIDIFAGHNARMFMPGEEYIELSYSSRNRQTINITGWKLKSKNGRETSIPAGTPLPMREKISPDENIILNPGDKAYVITGASPLGKSFKINKCIGYLGETQKFSPRLPNECPRPQKDEPIPSYTDDGCVNYLNKNFKTCTSPITLPAELSASCKEYIRTFAGYNQCVNRHQYDSDFYKPEWRIYLNQPAALWNDNAETISLYNEKNFIIDSYSY